MEAQDYPVAHFNGMERLALALKALTAQLLEHQYSYESFGNWSIVLKHKGHVAQVTFGGRGKHVGLRRSTDRKPPYSYGAEHTIGEGSEFGELNASTIEAICRAITSSK
jgi:hypothetical protein